MPGTYQDLELRLILIQDSRVIDPKLEAVLNAPGFIGQICTSVEQAHAMMVVRSFDAVVLNVGDPTAEEFQFFDECARRWPSMATLVIAESENADRAVRAAVAGVSEYFAKPLHPGTAIVRIHRAVELRRAEYDLHQRRRELERVLRARIEESQLEMERLEETSEEMLYAFSLALGYRDNETAQHCHRVTLISLELAAALGCSPSEKETIRRGAFLHDIGKIGIPDRILRKPGPLTPEERAIMEKHVRIGYEIVHRIPPLAASAEIVLTHHEHFDGTGYPQGLRGREIPLGSRIFAVADAFDAMTSNRPYRRALPDSVALDEIVQRAGSRYDPEVVQTFTSIPLELWSKIREDVEEMMGSKSPLFVERSIQPE